MHSRKWGLQCNGVEKRKAWGASLFTRLGKVELCQEGSKRQVLEVLKEIKKCIFFLFSLPGDNYHKVHSMFNVMIKIDVIKEAQSKKVSMS